MNNFGIVIYIALVLSTMIVAAIAVVRSYITNHPHWVITEARHARFYFVTNKTNALPNQGAHMRPIGRLEEIKLRRTLKRDGFHQRRNSSVTVFWKEDQ